MDGAINLQRLAEMKAGMQGGGRVVIPPVVPQVPQAPGAPEVPEAPTTPEAPAAPDIPAAPAPGADPAADPAGAGPDSGSETDPIADSLFDAITSAPDPEAARALVRDFLKEHQSAAAASSLSSLPEAAKNIEAAAKEYQDAADGMFDDHPHLRGRDEMLGLITDHEYSKDPKVPAKTLYANVAKRANGMLDLTSGGPSLPGSAKGFTPPVAPSPKTETRNDMRLRQLREGRGGNK